jgi:hypothetical protein
MKIILGAKRHQFLARICLFLVTVAFILGLVGCGQPCTLTVFSTSGGDVSVMQADTASWTEAQVGMSLEPGDIIKSGDNSSAEVTFLDGSTIELQAGTEIEVVSLNISTDTGSTTIRLKQTIGSIIFRVIKLVDPASRYEVETPTGAVAVRGSAMQVYVIEDGTTWACNLEGDIWAIAQGVELQIPEGRCCVIRPGQPPELVAFSSEEAANLELEEVIKASLLYFDDYGVWPVDSNNLIPVYLAGTARAIYYFDAEYGWVLDATFTGYGWEGVTFESGVPGPTGNHGRWVES